MCLITSVCLCAAENSWAMLSTASPKRPVCDTGSFRNCTFSCSMSVKHSQRWHSWTTSVDIARPRDCAVTFVARSARSIATRSSCRTARSGPAVTPWRWGKKPPSHRLYKHCQLVLTSTKQNNNNKSTYPGPWGRHGSPRRVVAAVGHSCMATDRSTEGMPVYTKAAPPSRVVRGEELQDLFRAVKGALYDLVSSSCTSGRMAPEGGAENQRDLHRETTRPASKNQDAVEDSTRAPHARPPGKASLGLAQTTLPHPKGATQRERAPSDAAIDIRSSGGAPKETVGVPRSAEVPARSIPAGCGVLERWGMPDCPCLTSRSLLCNSEMVMSP